MSSKSLSAVSADYLIDDGHVLSAEETARKAQAHRDFLEKNYWKIMAKRMLKDWRLYLMLIPLLSVFLLWRYLPLYDLLIAFKRHDATKKVTEMTFVGFQNFLSIIAGSDSALFWQAFRNTFLISFYGLVFGFPVPIIIALMFSEIKSDLYRSVLQVFTYLPRFVSTVVVTSLIGLLLRGGNQYFEPGVLASMLEKLGLISHDEMMLGVMNYPQYFRAVFQISGIWEGAGYGSIVYFAAIIGISPTNYEAARMDGASKLAQIRYVVLPGILSTITIMLILQIGALLTVGYEKVLLLYNPSTYQTADVVSTFVFRRGGLEAAGGASNQGIASAADLVNAVMSMILVIGANMIARRATKTSLF